MTEPDNYEFYSLDEVGESLKQTTIIRLLQVIKNKTNNLKPSYDGLLMTRFDFVGDKIGGMLINYIQESSPHYPFVLATIISYEQVEQDDDIAVFRDYAILGREEGLVMEKFEHIIDRSDIKWINQINPNHPDFNFINAALKDLNENKIVEENIGSNTVTDEEALDLLELIKAYKK